VFTDLDYADDAVLFAQDPGRWQAELKRFDDAATTMGLHTSWEKTKLQNIGYGPPSQSVSAEVTDKFIYGSTEAQLTPLVTLILTFFDESALHHQ